MIKADNLLHMEQDLFLNLWGIYGTEGWKQQGFAGNRPDKIMLAGIIQGKVQKTRVKDNGMVQRFTDGFDFMQFAGIDETEFPGI